MTTKIEGFHRLHEKNYGYGNRHKPIEIVNLRLRARGIPEKPVFEKSPLSSKTPPAGASVGERDVFFEYRPVKTRVYHRDLLRNGNRIPGPAIMVEYSSTIVIPPFAEAGVDEYGNIVMEIL